MAVKGFFVNWKLLCPMSFALNTSPPAMGFPSRQVESQCFMAKLRLVFRICRRVGAEPLRSYAVVFGGIVEMASQIAFQ